MLSHIIQFSIRNKFIVSLFVLFIIGFGLYSVTQIPIGAVPDITNNQVQVITTSRNLSTQDMEEFITYPVELEMANLPGVKEIRSVSKFGISVVTIVFDDDLGTYLPRQLIAEKLQTAKEKIPEGFGTPEMGPISTGLGEIYQYTLAVKPEFKDRYSPMDLRTIQDWIVKRQLSGIPGVVEVNTWGGHLKQYEVAFNNQKLQAMNVSISEVLTALENNNSVSGGGYIEKSNQSFFIRGEGLIGSIEDIGNIVVKNDTGVPVYVKDVAHVGVGSANRFGAITANGEGEKVMGQVMMLKGANSNEVINAVKERVEEISHTLPEGVYINPFLERSELIGKTMFTVSENLILGCLIVIFVVVLLLGNLRSGLVVASVIPLCLLFALSLMYIFGVDANLMSLGAIDFGIIIDGAVIIVEFIAFQITQRHAEFEGIEKKEIRKIKDKISFESASKMMNSAVFGQLIILIVFIPILSMSGVEGKMFKPMALVFSFALIGAMILCFTYVPMMASLFLKPSNPNKKNISTKLIAFLNRLYAPTIDWALGHKKFILGSALIVLLISVFIYSRMGGEFVPTLDEGDFVIQPILKTGTSLQKTIETTTRIEQILKEFPEVKQVVTRIGAAEVPTDPMSMEESDVIITLHPKSEWESASSKDELAEKFKEALAVIPGMEVEFTQPIEMRFNELITGVRADIAIKIFGEDLDVLSQKGEEIRKLIENVEGAADISVEKIEGLPQMNVQYNRAKIARYGLNIEEVNQTLALGFGGSIAGQVFEGERRFDLVVRLDPTQRKSLEDIKNLYVDLPNGGKIPLRELATISYTQGAAQISRDDTRRRMVVGINVRNRDLQSVVDDVQRIINEKVKLPTGYYITYGGQFENLQSASKRLMIAVPIALILIFIMLYFAFQSAKEATLIFSAIPFAAIGGVLLLWMRGLPFSISAGVGFIALFGIAVLNGIVLIEHFKELKKHQAFSDMNTLIKTGAQDRMRAVLLTAMAAALGFLPMAISQGAGAEVQRPLATVVIGGLISSTALTLIVLPVLYAVFHHLKKPIVSPPNKKVVGMLFLLACAGVQAQETFTLEDLLEKAIENHAEIKAQKLRIEESKALEKTSFYLDKTHVFYAYDENNLALNNKPLNVFGVQQQMAFPTVFSSRKKMLQAQTQWQNKQLDVQTKQLKKDISLVYETYQMYKEKESVYRQIDSLYRTFSSAASRKFELGESNYLEKVTAKARHQKVSLQLKQSQQDATIVHQQLMALIQSEDSLPIAIEKPTKLLPQWTDWESSPEKALLEQQSAMQEAEIKVKKQERLPDISVEYFQGSSSGLNEQLFGYKVGLHIPLFSGGKAKIKAAQLAKESQLQLNESVRIQHQAKITNLQQQLDKQEKSLQYYENQGLELADEIVRTAQRSFKLGEINFFEFIQSIELAHQSQLEYIEALYQYNQTIIQLTYITF